MNVVARSQHKDGYGSSWDPAHETSGSLPGDVSKKRSLQFWRKVAMNSIHHLYLVKMKRVQHIILDVFQCDILITLKNYLWFKDPSFFNICGFSLRICWILGHQFQRCWRRNILPDWRGSMLSISIFHGLSSEFEGLQHSVDEFSSMLKNSYSIIPTFIFSFEKKTDPTTMDPALWW